MGRHFGGWGRRISLPRRHIAWVSGQEWNTGATHVTGKEEYVRLLNREVKIIIKKNLLVQIGTPKSCSCKGIMFFRSINFIVFIVVQRSSRDLYISKQNQRRVSCGLLGFTFALFNPALFPDFLPVIFQIRAFCWSAGQESSPRAKAGVCFLVLSLSVLAKCLDCWHFSHILCMGDSRSDIYLYLTADEIFIWGGLPICALMKLK